MTQCAEGHAEWRLAVGAEKAGIMDRSSRYSSWSICRLCGAVCPAGRACGRRAAAPPECGAVLARPGCCRTGGLAVQQLGDRRWAVQLVNTHGSTASHAAGPCVFLHMHVTTTFYLVLSLSHSTVLPCRRLPCLP